MIIYHGSKEIIRTPQYGKGNRKNDYGLGFYCSESLELAKEWACTDTRSGYANQYDLNLDHLSILNLSEYSILHWLTILLKNRIFEIRNEVSMAGKQYLLKRFDIDTSSFDIIRGYRADDSYFSFAQDFLNNTITLQKLSKAMKLGKLGEQIVLISPKAFSQISFIGYEQADRKIYYPLRKSRDELARDSYFSDIRHSGLTSEDLFLADIIRERMGANDPRLQ